MPSPTSRTPAATPGTIARWRERIDALDAELIELLARRTRLSVRVAHWKRRSGVPLRTPAREAAILARARQAALAPLTARAAERIFRAILAEMRAAQSRHTRPARRT
jgi:chorismate mutase